MNSVVNYLDHWASLQPDKHFISFLDLDGHTTASYTYQDFARRTRHLAEHLSSNIRISHGERALLVYPPGLEIIAAFFACARLGIIPVPVVPPAPTNLTAGANRLVFIARDCEARIALTTSAYLESTQIALARCENSAPSINQLKQLQWVPTDGIKGEPSKDFGDTPSSVLFLQYTSGSTSEPKGVVVSHANVIHNARSTLDHVPTGVSWLPQYHDMGLIGYYLFPVISGGATFGFSAFDFLRRPLLWFRAISKFKATYTSTPNFGLEYCLREDKMPSQQLKELDLSSVRVFMNASEPVRAETHKAFLEKFSRCGLRPSSFVVAYGLAENTLAATHFGRRILTVNKRQLQENVVRIEEPFSRSEDQWSLVSCGRPLAGVSLRIVNAQTSEALPEGQIGEVWLSGSSASQGYWRRPELTREVFCNRIVNLPSDQNDYLKTGDLGFLHRGDLFICGRAKEIIKINGVNYYPQDVEGIVQSASGRVRAGGVAAINGSANGESLVVIAEVKRRDDLPNAAEIARAIRTQYYVSPQHIIFVPPGTIAKAASGKNARALTRQSFLEGDLPVLASHSFEHVPNTAKGNSGLAQRVREALQDYQLCPASDYTLAELGLGSLKIVELILEIETALRENGASELIAELNVQVLQQLRISELLSLLAEFETIPTYGINPLRSRLHRLHIEHDAKTSAEMRRDAVLQLPLGTSMVKSSVSVKDLLLTGPTGFLGPFLVSSLIKHTTCQLYVLVRAQSEQQGMERIRSALQRSGLLDRQCGEVLARRIHVLCGDISRPQLGLTSQRWEQLASTVDAVFHNAAGVNYVLDYETLKPHNIEGTQELIRFAFSRRQKQFHHISSTFIFGWTAKGRLFEEDNNHEMANLDFGYAQTKWVAEQLVYAAGRHGLPIRIYRPSLISASTGGVWDPNDIALRLLAFMINHRLGVWTENQISFLPVDVVADNIALIFARDPTLGETLHITTDEYYNMVDITRLITAEYGFPFVYHSIPDFVREMNRCCSSHDPLFPLLDFFNRSHQLISNMQLKRYDNSRYRAARNRISAGEHPSLGETVSCLMRYLLQARLIPNSPDNAAALRPNLIKSESTCPGPATALK